MLRKGGVGVGREIYRVNKTHKCTRPYAGYGTMTFVSM